MMNPYKKWCVNFSMKWGILREEKCDRCQGIKYRGWGDKDRFGILIT